MTERLETAARKALIDELAPSGWTEVDGRDAIMREFKFDNFVTAFGFMTRAALVAEKRGTITPNGSTSTTAGHGGAHDP